TDVNCNCAGQCFIIELSDDKSVRARQVETGNLRFYRKSIALSPETMEDTLRRELSAFSDNSVVDLRLSGSVTMDEYDTRHNLLEDLLGRFIEGTYSDAELSRLISEEIIDAEFAETSFAAGFLKDL